MFSEDDIIEIYDFLPPVKRLGSGELSDGLPLLTKTIHGKSFFTDTSLLREFKRIVDGAVSRVSINSASNSLDVGVDIVLQLVRANPSLALLSRGQHSIVPPRERSAIIKDLSDLLIKGVVNNSNFAESHDIDQESLQSLLRVSAIRDNLVHNTKDYLLSRTYSTLLSNAICVKLVDGVHSLESIELGPQTLPGAPPRWLIRQHIDHLKGYTVDQVDVVAKFQIEDKADAVYCTPKELAEKKRDKLIGDMQIGKLLYANKEELWRTFQELYPRLEDVDGHLSKMSSIRLIDDFAVSNKGLSDLAVEGISKYRDHGYIDILTILPPEVPLDVQSTVQTYLEQKIDEESNDGSSPIRRGNYLLTRQKYDDQLQAFLDLLTNQTKHQWDILKETPDKDLKAQPSEVVDSIPQDSHLLRYLAQQGEFEAVALDRVTSTISDLEIQNEQDFSKFWSEKVSLRLRNYIEGLKVINDAKLLEQLSELLAGYLQKDFLPDIVSKAKIQGLVRSRRTRKNINRFESTLKTGHTDLSSITATVDRFGKKQGIEAADTEAVEETKEALVQDMIRRMQKPKTDAPLMFLSFILVLFSRHNPGVVYATGKFSPKLLKLLKVQLSSNEYEQAERWKEQAKTGKLAQKDREMMIQMAEGVSTSSQESPHHESSDLA